VSWFPDRRCSRRRGAILPLALLVIAFLAVLAAQAVFRSNADLSAVEAAVATLQARMAAEAGINKAIVVLRRSLADVDAWYNNPEAFMGQIVYSAASDSGQTSLLEAPQEVSPANPPAWRFSLVADDPTSDLAVCRYGLTDEAAKLNINTASREQLETLLSLIIHDAEVNIAELTDALIDWRDSDDEPGPNGAESEYYELLDEPYAAKNRPFDTVEELLFVRGFTGKILFGEDWNRNGILDPNENDGDESFPPDNNDGQLDRGLYPYITVWSWEPNTTSDNRPRINLNASDVNRLAENLTQYSFSQDQVDAIIRARQGGAKFKTPLELVTGLQSGRGEQGVELFFGEEDLPLILDVLTTQALPVLPGLVNVNTAPVEVLIAVGFSDDEAGRIVEARATLSGEEKTTLAWLVDQGIVTPDRLAELYDKITVRSLQFTVEAVGFADHTGAFARLQAVIEMRGPLAQIRYWRDLSSLGLAWPVRSEEISSGVIDRG